MPSTKEQFPNDTLCKGADPLEKYRGLSLHPAQMQRDHASEGCRLVMVKDS